MFCVVSRTWQQCFHQRRRKMRWRRSYSGKSDWKKKHQRNRESREEGENFILKVSTQDFIHKKHCVVCLFLYNLPFHIFALLCVCVCVCGRCCWKPCINLILYISYITPPDSIHTHRHPYTAFLYTYISHFTLVVVLSSQNPPSLPPHQKKYIYISQQKWFGRCLLWPFLKSIFSTDTESERKQQQQQKKRRNNIQSTGWKIYIQYKYCTLNTRPTQRVWVKSKEKIERSQPGWEINKIWIISKRGPTFIVLDIHNRPLIDLAINALPSSVEY